MLNLEELNAFFAENFTRTAMRVETHQHLDIEGDRADFDAYLSGGDPAPRPWLDELRREVAEGRRRYRIHVIQEPLTDYMRFVTEWGYLDNVKAGEQVRFVGAAEHGWFGGRDFWVLDDEHVLSMHYDDRGRFVGAELEQDGEGWRELARQAWDMGTDLATWWADHPQYWRDQYLPTPRSTDDATTSRTDNPDREGAARAPR